MAGWVYTTSMVPLILAPSADNRWPLQPLTHATWGAWWLGYAAPAGHIKRIWFCAAWACMGLACMTKGIAAIALTGLIILAFIILSRDFRALRAMAWLPGLLIFAIIVLPWHLAVNSRNPEFAHYYFVVQHFGRLVSEEHSRPFWYFLVIFPSGMLFWTALFFPAMVNALKRALKGINLPTNLHQEKNERRDLGKTTKEGQKAGESEEFCSLSSGFWPLWVCSVSAGVNSFHTSCRAIRQWPC